MSLAKHLHIPRRQPDGRRAPTERTADVIAVASRNRVKAGVHPDKVRDQRAGYVLGRLALRGEEDREAKRTTTGITEAQFTAGLLYADTRQRYCRLMGIHDGTPRSVSMLMVAGDPMPADTAPTEDTIARARLDHDCMVAVVHAHETGYRNLIAINNAIILDMDIPEERDYLRAGLQSLIAHWKL